MSQLLGPQQSPSLTTDSARRAPSARAAPAGWDPGPLQLKLQDGPRPMPGIEPAPAGRWFHERDLLVPGAVVLSSHDRCWVARPPPAARSVTRPDGAADAPASRASGCSRPEAHVPQPADGPSCRRRLALERGDEGPVRHGPPDAAGVPGRRTPLAVGSSELYLRVHRQSWAEGARLEMEEGREPVLLARSSLLEPRIDVRSLLVSVQASLRPARRSPDRLSSSRSEPRVPGGPSATRLRRGRPGATSGLREGAEYGHALVRSPGR